MVHEIVVVLVCFECKVADQCILITLGTMMTQSKQRSLQILSVVNIKEQNVTHIFCASFVNKLLGEANIDQRFSDKNRTSRKKRFE